MCKNLFCFNEKIRAMLRFSVLQELFNLIEMSRTILLRANKLLQVAVCRRKVRAEVIVTIEDSMAVVTLEQLNQTLKCLQIKNSYITWSPNAGAKFHTKNSHPRFCDL